MLAGPSCGQLLADFGADVIKVEDVGGGRESQVGARGRRRGASYLSANRGKRGMTLNLKSAAGQQILASLVHKSDVVIDSLLPAVAERLGVDDAKPRALKPDLIHVTISGYGHDGPLAAKPGYDLMLQAFSGMMAMTGERDGGPIRAGASFIDMATGMLAFSGVSAALYARLAGKSHGPAYPRLAAGNRDRPARAITFPPTRWAGKLPPATASGVWHIVPLPGVPHATATCWRAPPTMPPGSDSAPPSALPSSAATRPTPPRPCASRVASR